MDLFKTIETFVRVANTGSFTAAADQMNLARSVVTRQIAALESSLGVILLNRSTRKLSLTTAGTLYLRQCRDILDRVQFAAESLHTTRDTPQGDIRFGIPQGIGMRYVMPLLTQFVSLYPKIQLQLVVGDDCLDLLEHGLDMAIHVTSRLDDNLVAKRLFISRRMLVAAPSYIAQKGVPVHPRELMNHLCIGAQPQERWPFLIENSLQEFPARSRFTCNDTQAQLQAAQSGLGIAYLPDFVVHDLLQKNELTVLLSPFTKAEQAVCLVCPGPRHISHQVRALAEFLATQFIDVAQQLTQHRG